ncbi:MAG TPA: mucoidy inhibitor MuiA family protein [Urbifossiella sp.]|nr:mucoidy inhibitor MuiA family protein [Urbifossiella sp.]
MRRALLLLAAVLAVAGARAQDAAVKAAPSKITAVTLYQQTALVTREVTLPEAPGLAEVVVSPLPAHTMQSSLYAEGGEGIRVLSVRFRTRAIAEDTREDVRKVEAQIKTLAQKAATLQSELKAIEDNLKLLDKLEGFTAKGLENLTDKGQLDADKIIVLAKFVQDDRAKRSKEAHALKQQLEENTAQLKFAQRQLGEKSTGSVRTERDAVITIDKKAGAAATVRLNYLVSSASWRPIYKLRAGTKDKDAVTLEYLAAIEQQTGEDWTGINLTLSTAQPLLNAAPPDLRVLAVSVGGPNLAMLDPKAEPGRSGPVPGGAPPGVGAGGGMPSASAIARDLDKQAKGQRAAAAENYRQNKDDVAAKLTNDAAAVEQFCDLFLDDAAGKGIPGAATPREGPSVAYRVKGGASLPSRGDEQVLEIDRFELAPKFYYKAVPVLTPNVYRLADLTNTSDHVLLPGEATMYLGSDFVGQTKLPLVAAGKGFTVGFGADPQIQVTRTLTEKNRTTQGGNQVLTFKYAVALSSYKREAVPVQVWDRVPSAESAMTIAVTVNNPTPTMSTDPTYLREERPKGLLRWDVTLRPDQNGEKALPIGYEFKMELDRNVNIGGFLAR